MRKHDWSVEFSIGIVCFREAPQGADRALAAADAVQVIEAPHSAFSLLDTLRPISSAS